MNIRTSILVFLTGVLALFAFSCTDNNAGQDQVNEQVIPVEVIPVTRGTMQETLDLLGDVKANQEVRVHSKIADRITDFKRDMGDEVNKGDLIATIENSSLQSRVDQMQANLEQAISQQENLEKEFNRLEELYAEDAISQSQYDATQAQLESARAQVRSLREGLKQAKTQMEDSYIRSPIPGVIGQRFLEEGDMATPQTPVVTVVRIDTVTVEINIVERYSQAIKPGLTAEIVVNSLPDTAFRGLVSKVSPVIDPRARVINAEIDIPNPDGLLRPGMFAEVNLIMQSHDNTLIVPKYSVLYRTQLKQRPSGAQEVVREYHVFTIESGRAVMKSIDPGFEDPSRIEVLSGLQDGDSLVIQGQNALEDSVKVRVVNQGGRS